MEAKQTPLIELLERIPQDARLVVEHDQFSSSVHPVGKLCREAAAALRAALAQQAEPVEPVAHCTLEQLVLLQRVVPSTGTIALYTTAPKREWVNLTEDQFLEASRLAEDGNYMVAFQRIQQWLKEKNT